MFFLVGKPSTLEVPVPNRLDLYCGPLSDMDYCDID